jgi:glycerol-1-phosphate dehydrogenase [NAD(P)+]
MKHLENLHYDKEWKKPEVVYGENLIPTVTGKGKYILATMEIPWKLCSKKLTNFPEKKIFVSDMNIETLRKLSLDLPKADFIVGLGGGSAHDTAKYLALKTQLPLVQIPTILSSDASVTNAIGIREKGKVKYIGHVYLDRLIVDFSVLKKAPPELIRYGACDIFSSHTALFDWKLAARRNKEKFNEKFYHRAGKMLEELKNNRFEIHDVTEKGIETIIEQYFSFAEIENKQSTPRAQEGAEHFFAYNTEFATGKSCVHGKLLALGIAVISYIQNNAFEETMTILKDLGVRTLPSHIPLGRKEFISVLTSLKNFVEKTPYYYSVLNEKKISSDFASEIYKLLNT